MQYSHYEKNHNRDQIYETRLRLIRDHNFNIKSSVQMYNYCMCCMEFVLIDFNN